MQLRCIKVETLRMCFSLCDVDVFVPCSDRPRGASILLRQGLVEWAGWEDSEAAVF